MALTARHFSRQLGRKTAQKAARDRAAPLSASAHEERCRAATHWLCRGKDHRYTQAHEERSRKPQGKTNPGENELAPYLGHLSNFCRVKSGPLELGNRISVQHVTRYFTPAVQTGQVPWARLERALPSSELATILPERG